MCVEESPRAGRIVGWVALKPRDGELEFVWYQWLVPASRLDLTRPRTVWGVISAALRCYGGHPGLFAVLGAVVVIPWGVAIWLIEGESLLTENHRGGTAGLIGVGIATLIAGPLISALHVNAVSDLGDSRPPQLGSVLARGTRVLPVVAAADVAAGLGTFVGLICLVIPGLILWARWAVVAQIAAIEDVSWVDCLRRSWQRTQGLALHALGVLFITGAAVAIIDLVIGGQLRPGDHVASIVIGIAVQTVLLSFQALTAAFLYYDLGAR